MVELSITTAGGKTKGTLTVSDKAFGREFNEPLVHQVVTAYLAGARSGTHAQKTRSEVRGGGKKPWRQKGTGRARAGTIRSPLWRSGGKIFAARTADYSQKINKKMYRGALCSILSELARQSRLIAVQEFTISAPKTKELLGRLAELGVSEALVVTDKIDVNLALAARNLPHVRVIETAEVDPVSLVRFEKVLMTAGAIKQLEEKLA